MNPPHIDFDSMDPQVQGVTPHYDFDGSAISPQVQGVNPQWEPTYGLSVGPIPRHTNEASWIVVVRQTVHAERLGGDGDLDRDHWEFLSRFGGGRSSGSLVTVPVSRRRWSRPQAHGIREVIPRTVPTDVRMGDGGGCRPCVGDGRSGDCDCSWTNSQVASASAGYDGTYVQRASTL